MDIRRTSNRGWAASGVIRDKHWGVQASDREECIKAALGTVEVILRQLARELEERAIEH